MLASMASDLLTTYDNAMVKLATAKAETAAAKAHYDDALDRERKAEADLADARAALQRAIGRGHGPTPTPGPSAGDGAGGSASDGSPPPPASDGSTSDAPSGATAPPPPPGVRKSLWELVLAIPRDGDVDMDDLRVKFNSITDAAINNRVTKAKKAGLVESAGWGRYALTDKGRKLLGQRFTVVNGDSTGN